MTTHNDSTICQGDQYSGFITTCKSRWQIMLKLLHLMQTSNLLAIITICNRAALVSSKMATGCIKKENKQIYKWMQRRSKWMHRSDLYNIKININTLTQIPWGERELCSYKSQDRSVVTKVNTTLSKNGLRSVSA